MRSRAVEVEPSAIEDVADWCCCLEKGRLSGIKI